MERKKCRLPVALLALYSTIGMLVDITPWSSWKEWNTFRSAVYTALTGIGPSVIGVFFLLAFFYHHSEQSVKEAFKSKRDRICVIFPALFFALCTIVGKGLIQEESVYIQGDSYHFFMWGLSGSAFFCFFIFATAYLQQVLMGQGKDTVIPCGVQHPFLIAFIILFVCYLPVLVLSYPALLMGDTDAQIGQGINIMGVEGAVTPLHNHHPVVHSLFLNFCMKIGRILGTC